MANARLVSQLGYLGLSAIDSYLAGRKGKAGRARLVTKPLLMPSLAVATHLSDEGRGGTVVRGVQSAQLFSWGGDLALLGSSKRSFLGGVGSFFVAHACYIGAFVSARDSRASLTDPGPRAAAATWLVAAPAMAYAAGRKEAGLRVPIGAYASILTAMFATSTTLDRSMSRRARRSIVAGTSLFLLSDSLLGIQKFLRNEPSPALESAVMATYTAGQWLIAEGAVAAGSDAAPSPARTGGKHRAGHHAGIPVAVPTGTPAPA